MRWLPLLCLLSFSPALYAQKSIHLSTTQYPPFYGKDLPGDGVVTEVILAAFAQSGYRVEISFYPFSRALLMAQTCKVDGLFAAWDSPERREWGLYSDPIPPANEVGFYQRQNDLNVLDTSTPAVTVGVVRDYVQPKLLNQPPIRQMAVTDDLTNLKKLSRGRVDLVLIDRLVADYLIQNHMQAWDGDPIAWVEPAIERYTQHLLLCKEAPAAQQKMADFNRGLRELKQSGEIDRILKKHHIRQRLKTRECAIEKMPTDDDSAGVSPHWLWP